MDRDICCTCTDKRCGHEPGEMCGRPINQQDAKIYYTTDPQTMEESGGWVCDECWERLTFP
jgi:hypothetical protein